MSMKRSRSLPPKNRINHTKNFKAQQKAKRQADDLYQSKDDLHKRPVACFPISCCTRPDNDFYSLSNSNNDARPLDINDDFYNNTGTHFNPDAYGDKNEQMPNVVPAMDRLHINNNNYPSDTSPYNNMKSPKAWNRHITPYTDPHHPKTPLMPDLLSSTHNKSYSNRGSRRRSKASSIIQSQNNQIGVMNTHASPYSNSSYIQYRDSTVAESRVCALHSGLPGIHHDTGNINFSTEQPPSQDDDMFSNAGTTFTFYNIETPQSPVDGAEPAGTMNADMHTIVSNLSVNSPLTNTNMVMYNRRNTPTKTSRLCNLGKSIIKFGKKGHPAMKQPGYFSCPKKLDLLDNGDCVVLDTENQTLQIFTPEGVCNKVYQFKFNIIDILVWNSQCIALLYQSQIGLFDLNSFEVNAVPLEGEFTHNPRVIDKLKDPVDGKQYFIIGMITEVVIYSETGDVVNTIGKCNNNSDDPLFKRINTLCVNPRNNDIHVLDGELKMVYTFMNTGEIKSILDTNSSDLGPLSNPLGMCINNHGHLLIADTFHHRILDVSQHLVKCLMQYSVDYYPNDVILTSDGKLIVAINSEGRTFAGVRIYNYKNH